ncbi:hypothetical protein LY76DRAFT_147537 [Colletotrichum caudatum]|nr:hypothetical protein LY76DRAFT_147537 [Colletotrichum caudatum]
MHGSLGCPFTKVPIDGKGRGGGRVEAHSGSLMNLPVQVGLRGWHPSTTPRVRESKFSSRDDICHLPMGYGDLPARKNAIRGTMQPELQSSDLIQSPKRNLEERTFFGETWPSTGRDEAPDRFKQVLPLDRCMDYAVAQHRLAAHGSRLTAMVHYGTGFKLSIRVSGGVSAPWSWSSYVVAPDLLLWSGRVGSSYAARLNRSQQKMPMMSYPVLARRSHAWPRWLARHNCCIVLDGLPPSFGIAWPLCS